MRTFVKITCSIALVAATLVSCKDTKSTNDETKNAENQNTTVTESTSETAQKVVSSVTVLNANLATEDELKTAGISSALISKILENRPFLTMDAFNGILDDEMDKTALYSKLFVPLNLNTTAEEDFKMIPGVGDRMAHEFEEYRPYTSIKQFRKEIGKYVDEEEVARYENFVFVPVELNTASEEDIKALPGVGNRMAHEFEEYRPYTSMAQFRKEIGKYVDDKELARLERFVYLKE